MAVFSRIVLLACGLVFCPLATAAVTGNRASLRFAAKTQNVSVSVNNQSEAPVMLQNCERSVALAAGGSVDLMFGHQDGFWVVPADLTWTCNEGPFDFFYVSSSLSESASEMSVGFGLDDRYAQEIVEEEEQLMYFNSNSTLQQEQTEVAGQQVSLDNKSTLEKTNFLGLTLVAGSVETSENSVTCDAQSCADVKDVVTSPDSFRLVLTGSGEKSALRGSFAQRRHQNHHSHHGDHKSRGGYGGWHQGGDKVWGRGSGTESIDSRNVGYYNRGMQAARARCGGAGCALIVNPPGHRTVNNFHIHFVHYGGYGANLKKRMEAKLCHGGGWKGGFPCHGRAAFFPGFPAVFSVAGGSAHSASVIAWPGSCGGRGTIVELAFGCSIEHQIRGDFNPALR